MKHDYQLMERGYANATLACQKSLTNLYLCLFLDRGFISGTPKRIAEQAERGPGGPGGEG